jgi:hypothetical protein
LKAAYLETEVFAQIPKDRGKTRGIIAMSAVELFRRAGAPEEASRLRREILANGELPDAWKVELEAIDIRHELEQVTGSGKGRDGRNGTERPSEIVMGDE